MSDQRRPYHREPEEQRKEALILATLEVMATGGAQAMTVRTIAERAGTTPGLIRHYFGTKDDLIRAAFERFMADMTAQSLPSPQADPGPKTGPLARMAAPDTAPKATPEAAQAIAAVIRASLRPPVMEGERVRVWAGFLQLAQQNAAMRATHKATYLGYRDRLQHLIEGLPGKSDPILARGLAIACNAVIDGLWLEGAILPDSFAPGEVERIALSAISAILDTDLNPDRTA